MFHVLCLWLTIECVSRAGRPQSVPKLAMGVDGPGSNPGGDEIFSTRSDRPWSTLSVINNGERVSAGGKADGAWR